MERLLFCADLHGNLGQFDAVISHALTEGIGLVVFGGDLTPKDAARRTPASQRTFLADELFPLFVEKVDPDVLEIFLILGNDDFRSNRDLLVKQQAAGVPFRLIDREPFVTEGGFVIVGYSSVPSTPFRFKCWERRDLASDTDFSARPDTRMEGVISRGDELVPYSLDEALALPSIEEDLFALTDGREMDRLVLVTHAPPFGTVCDFNREHRHVGSRGVRAFIEARLPYLTLHGHIHETVPLSGSFVEPIGRTRCVAVGNDHRPERPWVVEVGLGEDGPVIQRWRIQFCVWSGYRLVSSSVRCSWFSLTPSTVGFADACTDARPNLLSKIDIAPVSDFDDGDHETLIFDAVDNPVAPLPDSVSLPAGELFAARGSRIILQAIDTFKDALDVMVRNGAKVLCDGALEDQPIFSHAPSSRPAGPRS